jgi:DNA gyrase/topoisomerase IV subunit A
VSERGGVGLVELVILKALDSLGARADQPETANARVLAEVENRIGLAPGYAYEVLVDLARWWTVPVRLVHGEGDYGELRDDIPASHFRHTESRLSQAGDVVLASERGELGPVPVGLINGSTHRDGTRPPFRPERVIETMRQVIQRPRVTDAELVEMVGMPDFLTGCTVTGDLAALAAGYPTPLRLQAQVSVADDHRGVLVEHMPPNASRPRVMMEIADVARRRVRYGGRDRLPIQNIEDISRSGNDRFLCIPEPGTAPELLRDLLLDFEGITTTVATALPRPLPDLIRAWVQAHQNEDLMASLASLENAIHDQ